MKLTEEEKQNFEGIIDYLISDCDVSMAMCKVLEGILALYRAGSKDAAYLAFENLSGGESA